MKKYNKITASMLIIVFSIVSLVGCANDGKPIENDYIKITDYKGVEVDKVEPTEVTDGDINSKINEELKEREEKKEITDRDTVQSGDTVKCDYTGTIDGASFDGSKAADLEVLVTTIDEGYVKGLASNMIGHKVGEEFDGKVYYPDDYKDETIAGKTAVFHYTIKKIYSVKSYEATDDFVKEFIDGANTVEDWKKLIRKELEDKNQEDADYQMKQNIWAKVLSNTEVKKYPENRVEDEITQLENSYKNYAEETGITYEEFVQKNMGSNMNDFSQQLKNTAKTSVKTSLVIEAIAKKCKLELSEREYNKKLDEMAVEYGFDDKNAMVESYGDNLDLNDLKEQILRDEVQQWLLDNANIVEKKEESDTGNDNSETATTDSAKTEEDN